MNNLINTVVLNKKGNQFKVVKVNTLFELIIVMELYRTDRRKKYKIIMVGAGGAERIHAQMNEYQAVKTHITERNIQFTDDGATIDAVIPARYSEKFTQFSVTKH